MRKYIIFLPKNYVNREEYVILRNIYTIKINFTEIRFQHRRLSYSRHAVNDRDLSTQVNYKMHMNIRRLVGERRHHHRKSKKLNKVVLQHFYYKLIFRCYLFIKKNTNIIKRENYFFYSILRNNLFYF